MHRRISAIWKASNPWIVFYAAMWDTAKPKWHNVPYLSFVDNGKQVAVLVPTTVLALQHFTNFTERFSGTCHH